MHPDEVEKILSSLSNSTSFGLDMIDTFIIKLAKEDILPAITHIINLSISTKVFPTLWKKSKIIPLHKKEDTLNPKNYRPVAIIPILSKILERVIFNQMVAYITENSLVHPNHHAYRAGQNTTTALLQMYDVWLDSLEKGEMAGVCFLDMSAAFDIVDHPLLMKKLSLYGFESDMLEWVSSYLSERSQCVSIDGCVSKLQHVPHGVPQGSILGPSYISCSQMSFQKSSTMSVKLVSLPIIFRTENSPGQTTLCFVKPVEALVVMQMTQHTPVQDQLLQLFLTNCPASTK